MIKRFLLWVTLVVAAAYVVYGVQSLIIQRELAQKTLRLHVIAHSDDAEDQRQKLLVRDAVLEKAEALTASCVDVEQAAACLGSSLSLLQSEAERVLLAEGSAYEVVVTLEERSFDTRYYDSFTLPAGNYPALCVSIGAAQGRNWWCVVFPSLCTAATSEEFEQAVQTGGYSAGEQELVQRGEEEYILRFKTLEWIRRLSDLFS